jgi:hypothetical protein
MAKACVSQSTHTNNTQLSEGFTAAKHMGVFTDVKFSWGRQGEQGLIST